MRSINHMRIAAFLNLTIRTGSIVLIVLAFHAAIHGAAIGQIVVFGCGSIVLAIHGYGK